MLTNPTCFNSDVYFGEVLGAHLTVREVLLRCVPQEVPRLPQQVLVIQPSEFLVNHYSYKIKTICYN